MNVFDLLLSSGTKSASKPLPLGQNVHKGSFESLLNLFTQKQSSLLERKPTDSHVGQIKKENKHLSTFLDQSTQTKRSPATKTPTKQQRGLVEVTKEADSFHIRTKALEDGTVQKWGSHALSLQRGSIKREDLAIEPLKSKASKPPLPTERHFDAKTLQDPKIALQEHHERRSKERKVFRSISTHSIDKVAKKSVSQDNLKVAQVKKKKISRELHFQTAHTIGREILSPFVAHHEMIPRINTKSALSKEPNFKKALHDSQISGSSVFAKGPQGMRSEDQTARIQIERKKETNSNFLAKSDSATRATGEREKMTGRIDLAHTRKSGIDEVGVKKHPSVDLTISDTAASHKNDETSASLFPVTKTESGVVDLHENQERPLTRKIAGSPASLAKKSAETVANNKRGPLDPIKGDQHIQYPPLPHHNSTIVAASYHFVPHTTKSLHAKRSYEKTMQRKKTMPIDFNQDKGELHEWVKPVAEHSQKETPHIIKDLSLSSMTKESHHTSDQQSQDHAGEMGESHTAQRSEAPALHTQEHFQELVALQQRHRSLTLHIDQTRVNVSMHNSQLHLRFISSSILDTEGVEEYVDEVMREHGFEEYRVKIKDRKSELNVASLTARERSRASTIDVKV